MHEARSEAGHELPLWRRVVDYPLVAMLIAVALFIAAMALGLGIVRTLPAMDTNLRLVIQAAIYIALGIAVYKLAIVRLGEIRHDDLPVAGAARNLAIGLLLGLLLMSVIVGVAALFDVYNIIGDGGTSALLRLLIATAIVPGILEEIFFRGILFRWIEEFAGSWTALLLTAAFFGIAHIRNPGATRPWQHVLCPLSGYLLLVERLWDDHGVSGAWNFGPAEGDARPVGWIVERLDALWPGGLRWTRAGGEHPHEANFLKVDSSRARARLGWAPAWDLDAALGAIVEWYAGLREGADVRALSLAQLDRFRATTPR